MSFVIYKFSKIKESISKALNQGQENNCLQDISNKNILIIAVLSAFILAGVILGLNLKEKLKSSEPILTPQPYPNKVVCPQEAKICPDGSTVSRNSAKNCAFDECPTIDTGALDISNWKSYRDEKYGFEVRYPPSWKTKENSGINFAPSVVSLVSPETEKFIKSSLNTIGMSPAESDIDIYVYLLKDLARGSDQQITSLKDYLQKNSGPGNIVDFEEASYKGKKAYKVRLGGEGAYFAVFIDSAPYIYEILFELKANESELTTVEKQILATFEIKR